MSWVVMGGEGGEGGGRRERQRAGLRTDCSGGVDHRLRDTVGGREAGKYWFHRVCIGTVSLL